MKKSVKVNSKISELKEKQWNKNEKKHKSE